MKYQNTIYDQLDTHVKSSYNVAESDELSSIEVGDSVVYYKNGLPIACFEFYVQSTSMHGPQYAAVEFDYRFKLKE